MSARLWCGPAPSDSRRVAREGVVAWTLSVHAIFFCNAMIDGRRLTAIARFDSESVFTVPVDWGLVLGRARLQPCRHQPPQTPGFSHLRHCRRQVYANEEKRFKNFLRRSKPSNSRQGMARAAIATSYIQPSLASPSEARGRRPSRTREHPDTPIWLLQHPPATHTPAPAPAVRRV